MRIAMIGHKRIPSREGGIEIVVEELAFRMVLSGNEVDVYNRKDKRSAKKNKIANGKTYRGIRLITVPTINKRSFDALIYSLLSSIRAIFGRYDAIHYHAEGPGVMLLIPHLFKIRIVATIHGLDWQRAKWGGFATKYLLLGEKIIAKYADEVIVLSENMQNYFMQNYQRETNFIPNGIGLPEIVEAKVIEEKHNLKKGSYILFLARLVPEKGLHYLIEAYREIDTDIRLVIAGGPSHSDDYYRKIVGQAQIDTRIIMTGFVSGRELEELYSNCLVYVLPSDLEGMPISLLEAMSYGSHCLISNIPENVEVADEYAQVFLKGNIADLRSKLKEMLSQLTPADMNDTEIQNYIISKYNWEDIVSRTIKLYKS